MFQASMRRLRALLTLADDILGDPEPVADATLGDPEPVAPHPHRRPVRLEHQRRPGAVRPRPAHCISPVRDRSELVWRDRVG
jgi:hypothetical protein